MMIKCRCGRIHIDGLEVVYHKRDGKVLVDNLLYTLDEMLDMDNWSYEIHPCDSYRVPSSKHSTDEWHLNMRGIGHKTVYVYCYRIEKVGEFKPLREVEPMVKECIVFKLPYKKLVGEFVEVAKDLDAFIEQLY